MSTSPSDFAPPGLLTKKSNHPLAQVLLGQVVGAHFMQDVLILYYADGHKAAITTDEEGDIVATDHEITGC